MMADLGGTFLVYATEPDIVFQTGKPLLLTHRRRVRAKNIVLIATGRIVAAWSSSTATPGPIAAIADPSEASINSAGHGGRSDWSDLSTRYWLWFGPSVGGSVKGDKAGRTAMITDHYGGWLPIHP
jgi:hypothetical protein